MKVRLTIRRFVLKAKEVSMSSAKTLLVGLVVGVGIILSSSGPAGDAFVQSPKNPPLNSSVSIKAWNSCLVGNPHGNIPVDEFPSNVNPNAVINSRLCNLAVLKDINAQHRLEGVPPMVLPPNYTNLSPAEQLVLVVNAERESRNIAPFVGMTESLDKDALKAALAGNDPNPSIGDGNWIIYNSIWAGGYQSALLADFDWMYNDGWGGNLNNTINVDCTSSKSRGCWGHRDAILAIYPPTDGTFIVAGAAMVTSGVKSLALPSWAAAFEQVPSDNVRFATVFK